MGKLSALVIALTIIGIHPAFSAEVKNEIDESIKAVKFVRSDKTMKDLVSDGFNISTYDYTRFYDRNQTKVTAREAYVLQKGDDAYKCVLMIVNSVKIQSGEETRDHVETICFHLE